MTRVGRIDNEFKEFKAEVLKRLEDIESKLANNVQLKEVDLTRVMNELPAESTPKKKLPPKKKKEEDIVLEAKDGEIIAID